MRPASTVNLLDAMNNALLAADPEARTVPYMLSAGTDAKALRRAGNSLFRVRPAASCRPTWISPRCSTASMSGYPSMH